MEKKIEVKTFRIIMECSENGCDGQMVCLPPYLQQCKGMSCRNKIHQCNKCRRRATYLTAYPATVYEPIKTEA